MNGWVALASVIATGAVGLGGLVVTYKSGGAQRKHEASLAHSARVWEQKSAALFEVITIARRLLDGLDSPHDVEREMFAVRLAPKAWRLDELLPVIEAYASRDCREAFESLRSLLATSGFDSLAEYAVEDSRAEKVNAIDAGDFDAAVVARNKERTKIREANDALVIDRDEVRLRARRLIETARQSLRA